MGEHRIDRFARALVAPHSRRATLKALLALALTALCSDRPQRVRATTEAEALVAVYYQAIAGYDYQRAYSYLGAAMRQRQTLDQFTQGYADTAYVGARITGVTPEAVGGSTVAVRLVAWHNDGTIHQYSGIYTVGAEGGVSKLANAAIHEDPTPANVPPLCHPADLTATSLADAGAGNRFATVTLTNTSPRPCVLGGYPHVALQDATGQPLIGSTHDPNRSIATVTLKSGSGASFMLRWVNWCGRDPGASFTASVDLPGDTVDRLMVSNPIGVPPCLGSTQPSLFTTTPFAAS